MASKLSEKQLKTREFILSVFKKEARPAKSTLNKLMLIYADKNNIEIVEKYGPGIIASFLDMYTFRNFDDYTEIMDILQNSPYFDTKITFYSQFNNIITKKLFDSSSIPTDWILERMRFLISFFEINNTIGFIYTREKSNILEILNKAIDYINGYTQDLVVFEAIVRHGMTKKIPGLYLVFEKIFETGKLIEIESIVKRYDSIIDKDIKSVIGAYLHLVTKDDKYLPEDVQTIFIF